MFYEIYAGAEPKATFKAMAQRVGVDMDKVLDKGYDDVNVVHGVFGSACYIDDSFPSMLYMAYKWVARPRLGEVLRAACALRCPLWFQQDCAVNVGCAAWWQCCGVVVLWCSAAY